MVGSDLGVGKQGLGWAVRLELSSEGRYALRALVHLACVGGRISAGDVARETGIPPRLLARIMARVTEAGLVASTPGRGGGSWLARPAEEITLREVVEAVEGPFVVTRCIMEDRPCGRGGRCTMHDAWIAAQQAFLDRLQEETLAGYISATIPQRYRRDT